MRKQTLYAHLKRFRVHRFFRRSVRQRGNLYSSQQLEKEIAKD